MNSRQFLPLISQPVRHHKDYSVNGNDLVKEFYTDRLNWQCYRCTCDSSVELIWVSLLQTRYIAPPLQPGHGRVFHIFEPRYISVIWCYCDSLYGLFWTSITNVSPLFTIVVHCSLFFVKIFYQTVRLLVWTCFFLCTSCQLSVWLMRQIEGCWVRSEGNVWLAIWGHCAWGLILTLFQILSWSWSLAATYWIDLTRVWPPFS